MRLCLSTIRCLLGACITLVLAVAAFAQGVTPRLDLYGDPLPPGAVVRLGTKRLQTTGGFAWTPGGKSLATLHGGTVDFWDLEDGHSRETVLVPVSTDIYGTRLLLSKDGQRLVCADWTGALATWDLATSQMASLPGDSKWPNHENIAVALHPDGKQFVTLRPSGELNVRDFATCNVKRSILLKEKDWSEFPQAAFSPNGKLLALGNNGNSSIYLLDIEKETEPVIIKKAHGLVIYQLGFLADGRLFSVGTRRGPLATVDDPHPHQQYQLLTWDLSKEPPSSREFPVTGGLAEGCGVAFSADGRLLVTVHNDRLVVWDVATEKITRTISGLHFRVAMHAIVAIDPTGTYVAVDDRQNYVRIWELATGKPVLSTEQHHQAAVNAAVWSPDGTRIVTGSRDREVRVWEAASGKPLKSFRGPDWGVYSVRYMPDGAQLVLCGHQAREWNFVRGQVSGPVRWHDAESGKLLREVWLPARAQRLLPSPDGLRVAVATNAVEIESADGSEELSPPAVRLLDAKTGKEVGKVDLDNGHANALCWSADSKTLLAVSGSKVIHIDAQTLKSVAEVVLPHLHVEPRTLLFEESTFFNAVFLRHGEGIVTAGALKEIYGWKLPGGRKEWTFKTDGYYKAMVLSPDERLLAAVCQAESQPQKLVLFDVAARRLVTSCDLGRNSATRAEFSPGGNRILVGFEDGTALVYDIADVE